MNKIPSEKAVVEGMLVETVAQVMKMKITDRLFRRAQIRGNLDADGLKRMSQNQQSLRMAETTIKDLQEILSEAKDDDPLAEIFPQV
jgi:hypothetical protein